MLKVILSITLIIQILFGYTVQIQNFDMTPSSKITKIQEQPIPLSATSKKASKRLHIKGSQIVNSQNQVIQLKGLSSHGLSWYPQYINKKTFSKLKTDFKINTIRLAMYTEEYKGYCVSGSKQKKYLKQLIDKGIKYAKELDMYVIIDWHILSDGNPNKHVKEATAFFSEMAKKYRKEEHIIYEICNEPNHTSWNQIKKFANKVIPAIRKYNKNALIIVGTPTWSQDVDKISKLSDKNTLYALHFYAGTHKQSLRTKANNAIKKKTPIFVSEFGICNASGNGAINKTEAKKWLEFLDKNKISYVGWNISNKNESSAILKASCQKTSGFKSSDYSVAGNWLRNYFSKKKNIDQKKKTKPQKSTPIKKNTTPKITTKCINQWNENNNKMTQWDLSIKNNHKTRKSWTLKLTFNQSFKVSQHWNFNYKVTGKTLIITPVSYNIKINPNVLIKNIGMILKSKKGLKIIKSSFY